MRHHARRRGIMVPIAFAMLLSVAAGLSLAEEHIRPPAAAGRPLIHANALRERPSQAPPKNGGTTAKERGGDTRTGTGDGGKSQASGVGSRALTGNEAPDASDQPEMATGMDLGGPPLRFRAADTPE